MAIGSFHQTAATAPTKAKNATSGMTKRKVFLRFIPRVVSCWLLSQLPGNHPCCLPLANVSHVRRSFGTNQQADINLVAGPDTIYTTVPRKLSITERVKARATVIYCPAHQPPT